MIGILDLELGNLRSVFNAFYELGYDVDVVRPADDLERLTHLVIPGVGNFLSAASHIRQRGVREQIDTYMSTGRPLLGICLGMQLFAQCSEEAPGEKGLALIPAEVRHLAVGSSAPLMRLPHVGWNEVDTTIEHPVLEGVKSGIDFYFAHSFGYHDLDPSFILATTPYVDVVFPSIICRDNFIGFQFHPEKSQKNGLRLIENFATWNGSC